MNEEHVRRTIEELERRLTQEAIADVEQGLADDDPAFVQRTQDFCRAETRAAFTVFLLLALGAVLLTVGVATFSWVTWTAGLLAFLASFLVNERHKNLLDRGKADPPPEPPPARPLW